MNIKFLSLFNEESKGEIAIFVSGFFHGSMAILVKIASSNFNGLFILMARFSIGIFLCILILKILKKKIIIHDKKAWILRGIFGCIAMALWYSAITITSSGRATLLNLTYPIFVSVISYLFYNEKITINNILAIVLCIIGSILIFYDGSKYSLFGDFLGLLSGIFAGLAVIYIKKSSNHNHPIVTYLSPCLIGLLILPFVTNQINEINLTSIVPLLILGVITFIGHMFMNYGFKHVLAAKGSIILYSELLFAIMLSYLIIGEEFKIKFFIGMIFIIIGLFINSRKLSINRGIKIKY